MRSSLLSRLVPCGPGGGTGRRRGGIKRVAQGHASEQRAQAKSGVLERLVGVQKIGDRRTSRAAAVGVESSRDAGRVLRTVMYILAESLSAGERVTLDGGRDIDGLPVFCRAIAAD